MIEPFLKDDEFLADVESVRSEQDHFSLWWLGQSGFLVQWNQHHLLFDPYLSDSLTKKYEATDKPHIRMTKRVIAPDRLNFIDVVTSSHNHTDHLDTETLLPLFKANPKMDLIIPEANRAFVADRLRISVDSPVGLDSGHHVTRKGFKIHGVPAAHESMECDDEGRCKFLGYVVQFGGWTIYHSGDTVRYPGMVEVLRQFPIDVALLPINGANPERRVAGNLNGREAVELAREVGARCVIPCHYEMFSFNTADPKQFAEIATDFGVPFHLLRAGERWGSRQIRS